MSSKSKNKVVTLAAGAMLLGGLSAVNTQIADAKVLTNHADLGSGSSVRANLLSQSELNASPWEFAGDGEGKCGEGKCGEGKCGEGKCGEDKSGEGKCGEGKCGEGKCGEGKDGKDKK